MWEVHHRREIQNGKTYSRQYLIDNDLYYNRPASELIFMTEEEHVRLHHSGNRNQFYGVGPFNGHKHSEETKQKMRETHKVNFNEDIRIKRSMATKGRIWVNDGKTNHLVLPDKIPDGFIKGRMKQQ